LYEIEKDYEKALKCLEKAQRICPENPVSAEKIGEVLFKQGKYHEAKKYFIEALDLDENRTRTLYYLALLNTENSQEIEEKQINVELGGGIFPTKIRCENQNDYINVDVLDWPTVDVVADLGEKLPFPNNSVHNIFSREMIEHLPFKKLPVFIAECFRTLKKGGNMYLCCPDFEAITRLYEKRCHCVTDGVASRECPYCRGEALVSDHYWKSNLLGNQDDYGEGGVNDTHKNQIDFKYLKTLLETAGFNEIERDHTNQYYEGWKRNIKLSVSCVKPN
jgi:tetratricopeptide (TPR) repeat protein